MHLKANATHANRIADAFLRIVQYIVARDRMQDPLVGGNRDSPCGIQHAIQVGVGHLAVPNRDDALRVATLHVVAGDRSVDAAHFAASHQLGFFHRALDGLHGGVDIDHHASAQSP